MEPLELADIHFCEMPSFVRRKKMKFMLSLSKLVRKAQKMSMSITFMWVGVKVRNVSRHQSKNYPTNMLFITWLVTINVNSVR